MNNPASLLSGQGLLCLPSVHCRLSEIPWPRLELSGSVPWQHKQNIPFQSRKKHMVRMSLYTGKLVPRQTRDSIVSTSADYHMRLMNQNSTPIPPPLLQLSVCECVCACACVCVCVCVHVRVCVCVCAW